MGKIINLDEEVAILEKWIHTQGNLPQFIDDQLLKRFYYTCYGDLNKAKKLIELNYSMRNNHSHIFLKRDPLDNGSTKLLEVADLIPLPGLTKDKSKILLYRLCDYDSDKFSLTDGVKVFFMLADCRFLVSESEGLADGEIPVFDMKGFSLKHLTKVIFNINSLRIYMKFVQEAHPVRLKAVHVLNCPSYLDKVLTVVKPFIRSDVFKLINFHLPGSNTISEHIPNEMLPKEYGGTSDANIPELKKKWVENLKENRAYLMNQKHWKAKDTKSPNSKSQEIKENNIESLKSLSID